MKSSNPHPATVGNLEPVCEAGPSDKYPEDSVHWGYEDLNPSDSSSSCMTTKELQQYWRAEKQRLRPIKLLFEIPLARTIDQTLTKYVVYQIVVIRSGSYDSQRVSVERRYSDFARFHHQLLQNFNEELEDVKLPRKFLTGNFNPDCILERRLALQDYLGQLYAIRCVRQCRQFLDFFTEPEQIRAYGLLRSGQFQMALELLHVVLDLQEKLAQWYNPVQLVPTQCALAVCHRDLDEQVIAFAMGQRALPAVRRYGIRRYRGPLLAMLVDLGYQLGRPVAQLQEELTQVKDAERGQVSFRSLKEVVVQEFI
ncbi:sorting nexin-20 [Osmerus eperlanus]|uniref:sorting nexin-20 n=1 Tax=Osmerus eperlanus TaxID=29151 RepID=UPI002E1656DB